MAKKIQISTIREMANVQIIRINASFVANAIKKQMDLEKAIENTNYLVSNTDNDELIVATHNLLCKVLEFFHELENAFDKEDDESRPRTPIARPLTLEEAMEKVNYLLETGKTPEEIAKMDDAGEDFGNLEVHEYLAHLETLRNCK